MDQNILALAFIGIFILVLVYNRRKVQVQKILFPIIYFVLVRTSWGIKLMDWIAKRGRPILKPLSTLSIGIGFLGMLLMVAQLLVIFFSNLITRQAAEGVGVVQPFVQNVPGTIFVPFLYFIIAIPVIAIIHEFSHGVVARVYNIKVKSSGFAFLNIVVPIIPAAFVEPDEKVLFKRPLKQQLAVFASGPVSNLFTALFVIILFIGVLAPAVDKAVAFDGIEITGFTEAEGEKFPAEAAGLQVGEVIQVLDGKRITHFENFSQVMNTKRPGDKLKVGTDKGKYDVVLAQHPTGDKPFVGINGKPSIATQPEFKEQYGDFAAQFFLWFIGLLYWIYLLSLGIGLFNLVPLGPIDGGRMVQAVLDKYIPKQSKQVFKWLSIIVLGVILVTILTTLILPMIN